MTTEDDGFREIQLNGKQLVFLFMAATVVLVVCFLTGVLVGRSVRTERTETAQNEASTDAPVAAVPHTTTATPDEGIDPRKAQPPSPVDDIDISARPKRGTTEEQPPVAVSRPAVDQPAPVSKPATKPAELTSKPAEVPARAADAASKPAPPPRVAPASAAAAQNQAAAPPAVPPPAAAVAKASTSAVDAPKSKEPIADPVDRAGYAVQVAAVNARGEADSIVKRLSSKGYPAYVEAPKGSVTMFRVRVGTFKTRREAQTTAERLKRDEKFKPWVTR